MHGSVCAGKLVLGYQREKGGLNRLIVWGEYKTKQRVNKQLTQLKTYS